MALALIKPSENHLAKVQAVALEAARKRTAKRREMDDDDEDAIFLLL